MQITCNTSGTHHMQHVCLSANHMQHVWHSSHAACVPQCKSRATRLALITCSMCASVQITCNTSGTHHMQHVCLSANHVQHVWHSSHAACVPQCKSRATRLALITCSMCASVQITCNTSGTHHMQHVCLSANHVQHVWHSSHAACVPQCKSRATCLALITCSMCASWHQGTAQLPSSTEN